MQWIFASYWYWFSLAAALLLLEILIPGIFLLWLGLGAIGVGVLLLLFPNAELAWQLAMLISSMSLSVLAGLKWQRKIISQQPATLNLGLEGYLGRSAIVIQDFNQGRGRIRLDDSSFPAKAIDFDAKAGQQVVISTIEENIFVVSLAQ